MGEMAVPADTKGCKEEIGELLMASCRCKSHSTGKLLSFWKCNNTCAFPLPSGISITPKNLPGPASKGKPRLKVSAKFLPSGDHRMEAQLITSASWIEENC